MKNRKSDTAAAIRKLKPSLTPAFRSLNPTSKDKQLAALYSQGFAEARSLAAQLVQEQFDREIASITLDLRIQQLAHMNNL